MRVLLAKMALIGLLLLIAPLGGCERLDKALVILTAPSATEVATTPSTQVRSAPPPALVAGGQDTPTPGRVVVTSLRADDVIPAGQGEPWYTHDQKLSRVQFAQALRTDDPNKLRVRAAEIARQVAERGLPAPSTPEAFADWIEKDSHIIVIACTQAIIDGNYMSRTNPTGKLIDLHWDGRKACASGEQILAYKYDNGVVDPFESLWCGNILTPKVAPTPVVAQVAKASPPAPAPVLQVAQNVPQAGCAAYVAQLNLWSRSNMSPALRSQMDALIAEEQPRIGFGGRSFPSEMGGELRRRAENGETLLRSNAQVTVRFVLRQVKPDGSVVDQLIGTQTTLNALARQEIPASAFAGNSILRVLFKPDEVVYPLKKPSAADREMQVTISATGEWKPTLCTANLHAAVD